MAAMASTAWASPVANAAFVATSSQSARESRPCACRTSGLSSSFLGSGVHGASMSPIFNLDRISSSARSVQTWREQKPKNLVVRSLFGLGVPELAVIAGVAAILFGPKKLPEIGKSLGKTVKSFQQAAKEFETEIKNAPGSEVEASATESPNTETKAPTPVSNPVSKAPTSSSDQESA